MIVEEGEEWREKERQERWKEEGKLRPKLMEEKRELLRQISMEYRKSS